MLTHRPILDTADLRVTAVRCPGGVAWSPEEQVTHTSVVLVRRGAFRRRVDGRWSLADPVSGYVQRPGECQQVAHPAGGDVCTSIGVPDELGERLAHAGPLVVDPAADLTHRRLLTGGPEAADHAHDLLTLLLPRSRSAIPPPAVRGCVDDVRAALHAVPGLTLDDLAARVGWSPWHLSRTFHRVTGATLGAYRRRLRVRAALDALAVGGESLAAIAARAGFADQAHLTRELRREIGLAPSAARRLLRPGRAEPALRGESPLHRRGWRGARDNDAAVTTHGSAV